MSVPSDPAAAAEATRLSDIREEVEYKVSRLRPDKITASNAANTKEKLSDILNLANKYGIYITALLKNNPSMVRGRFRCTLLEKRNLVSTS